MSGKNNVFEASKIASLGKWQLLIGVPARFGTQWLDSIAMPARHWS